MAQRKLRHLQSYCMARYVYDAYCAVATACRGMHGLKLHYADTSAIDRPGETMQDSTLTLHVNHCETSE